MKTEDMTPEEQDLYEMGPGLGFSHLPAASEAVITGRPPSHISALISEYAGELAEITRWYQQVALIVKDPGECGLALANSLGWDGESVVQPILQRNLFVKDIEDEKTARWLVFPAPGRMLVISGDDVVPVQVGARGVWLPCNADEPMLPALNSW